MAFKRMSVKKIKEILRLHFESGLSLRAIGRAVGKSPSVVHDTLARFRRSGLVWPLEEPLDDDAIEKKLYRPESSCQNRDGLVTPDFKEIHTELKRKHVTLRLLWEEYKLAHQERGFGYSRFCELYREWSRPLDAVLRFEYKAGERAFVDWSGDGIDVVDRETGEVSEAPLFVGVLGASGYTFAKAAPSRESAHWLRLHSEMFEHFDGVTQTLVPDNEKTGVTNPCYYDPDLNPSYAAWAKHYGTAVLPARPRKPRDKALVENAVLNVQRFILARLRNHKFFSLEEANREIARLASEFNAKPLQKLDVSRRELYEHVDRPALMALPLRRFEPFETVKRTVNIDYHVVVEGHYYSVSYTLIGKKVEARWTSTTVEIFHNGNRVASHPRSFKDCGWSTIADHRPEKHRAHLEWTPERIIRWAEQTGPFTAQLVEKILASRIYPEQGYRACLGVLRLGKKYGVDQLEPACQRALALRSPKYRTVSEILKSGSQRCPLPVRETVGCTQFVLPHHNNIRGPEGYH